jgi:hypothetical protein
MRISLLAATASALLLAGAAAAQPSTAPADVSPAPDAAAPSASVNPPAPPSDTAPAPASGYNANPTASGSGQFTGDLAQAKAGDPGITSNGPVPDTKENRAKYGKPDSNAGKRTRAAGN